MCIESCGKPGWFDAFILWFILMLDFCVAFSALGPTYSIYQTPNVYFTVKSQKINLAGAILLVRLYILIRLTDLVQQKKKLLNNDNNNFPEKDIDIGKMFVMIIVRRVFEHCLKHWQIKKCQGSKGKQCLSTEKSF